MLYAKLFLEAQSPENPNGIPDIPAKKVLELIKNYKYAKEHQISLALLSNDYEITRCFFTTLQQTDNTIRLYLKLYFKKKGLKTEQKINIAQVDLHGFPANCSTVIMTQLQTTMFEQCGFADILHSEVIKWAERAGYTFLLCSTAGYQNKIMDPFLTKRGWKETVEKYKNPRSGNSIRWYAYEIHNQKEAK